MAFDLDVWAEVRKCDTSDKVINSSGCGCQEVLPGCYGKPGCGGLPWIALCKAEYFLGSVHHPSATKGEYRG